jgi:hypothetical protein
MFGSALHLVLGDSHLQGIDADVADPAMFNTAVPDWKVGRRVLASSELQRFRILSIHPNEDETKLDVWHAVWRVEPVRP